MTDHVPGPWHYKKTSVVCFYGTRRIQVATTRQPLFTTEAQAANARLIAAAPDLLAALIDAESAMFHVRADGGFATAADRQAMDDAWSAARAAIAKATGQAD